MPATTTTTETDIFAELGAAFEKMYQVIVLDSDNTTFDQVIYALVTLFNYTEAEAGRLALQVDETGKAIVHYCRPDEADKYVTALQRRNVRARAEQMPS